jgi:hypothetical protein
MPAYTDADIRTITGIAKETGAVEIKTVHA